MTMSVSWVGGWRSCWRITAAPALVLGSSVASRVRTSAGGAGGGSCASDGCELGCVGGPLWKESGRPLPLLSLLNVCRRLERLVLRCFFGGGTPVWRASRED